MTYHALAGAPSTDRPELDRPPPDPWRLAEQWLAEAEQKGVQEPRALALATVDADGRPSTRMVTLKALRSDGAMFTTSSASRKGRDVRLNPWAAGTLYWRETIQQLHVIGHIERLPDAVADRLFAARPRAARAVAKVSRQSETLDDEDRLNTEVTRLIAAPTEISRPSDWGAFVLVPQEIEFWCGSPDRFHRRLRYIRSEAGWRTTRLQP